MDSKSYCNPLNNESWFLVQCYFQHNYKDFTMHVHSHDRIEIMYVNSGEMKLDYLENDKMLAITVKTSEYVLIDSGIPHKITIAPEMPAQIFNIELELFKLNSPIKFTMKRLIDSSENIRSLIEAQTPILKLLDDGSLYRYIVALHDYIGDRPKATEDVHLDLLVAIIFTTIADTFCKRGYSNIGNIHLRSAMKYVDENYQKPITSARLARIANVSQNYLNKIFTDNLGQTVINYINRVRIERATILMRKTNMHIAEIYKSVGFENKQNFYKNFSKFLKVSPGQYMKIYKSQDHFKYFVSEDDNIIWTF